MPSNAVMCVKCFVNDIVILLLRDLCYNQTILAQDFQPGLCKVGWFPVQSWPVGLPARQWDGVPTPLCGVLKSRPLLSFTLEAR